jgi:DNA-binding FadR family transcriptional regulator
METTQADIFTAFHSSNPLEDAMDRIAGAIRARLLSPGDRLPPERELAAQLGVSRSTLRVVLQNLTEDGWLEVRRGRRGGSFVARWPKMPKACQLPEVLTRYGHDLPGLLDYRRAVETAAAAYAAARATAEEIAELETINTLIAESIDDLETCRACDTRFHIGVARAAHSPRLMEAVTEVETEIAEILDVLIHHTNDSLREMVEQHWLILDAIRDQDEETARRVMLEHVVVTEQMIFNLGPEENLKFLEVRG